MSESYAGRLLSYDNWANRGILAFLRTQPPEVLQATAAGVYGTLGETLQHLLGAELRYHAQINRLPLSTLPPPAQRPALEELQALAKEAAGRVDALKRSLPGPDDMVETVDGPRAASTIVTQLVMHGCEHRGHIATILGTNGITGPELDGWAYGIFAGNDAWLPEWGPEPAPRPEFPRPEWK